MIEFYIELFDEDGIVERITEIYPSKVYYTILKHTKSVSEASTAELFCDKTSRRGEILERELFKIQTV